MKRPLIAILTLILITVLGSASAEPLSTAFTYQGLINLSETPLTGTADFQFALYDALTGGVQVGTTLSINNATVTDGIFAAQLDFGVSVFNGDARYLEIQVRSPAGSGGYTTLDPRVNMTATPYALQTRGLFVDDSGNVSVGVDAQLARGTISRLHVESPTNAIFGEATATTGMTEGVRGEATSSDGRGVFGKNHDPGGEGVRGEGGVGICGVGDTSAGVLGEALADSAAGVFGKTDAPGGEGVRGDGETGVCGVSDDNGGRGVVGDATGTGESVGVEGKSANGEGVRGEGPTGVCGVSDATDGIGVVGEASGPGANTIGVSGDASASPSGIGVHGNGPTGVRGDGVVGVHGDGTIGVQGTAAGSGNAGVNGYLGEGPPPSAPFPVAAGVYGLAESTQTADETFGVHGQAMGQFGAGVLAEGTGPSSDVSALEIRRGGIVVSSESGTDRPAGAEFIDPQSLNWVPDVTSCNHPSGGGHFHVIGHTATFVLLNQYIHDESVVLLTMENEDHPPDDKLAYSAHIIDRSEGAIEVELSAMGTHSPATCTDPSDNLRLNYLIITPVEL